MAPQLPVPEQPQGDELGDEAELEGSDFAGLATAQLAGMAQAGDANDDDDNDDDADDNVSESGGSSGESSDGFDELDGDGGLMRMGTLVVGAQATTA